MKLHQVEVADRGNVKIKFTDDKGMKTEALDVDVGLRELQGFLQCDASFETVRLDISYVIVEVTPGERTGAAV